MAETLTGDELVAACLDLMTEKGVTVDELVAEGWGDPNDLSEDEVTDVVAWLGSYKQIPKPHRPDGTTDVQMKMVQEARDAGLRASDSQADPAKKRGFLFEKKLGGRRVTVEDDVKASREGRVALVGRVWVGDAILYTEREMVTESNLEGKTKQLAFRLIEKHAKA